MKRLIFAILLLISTNYVFSQKNTSECRPQAAPYWTGRCDDWAKHDGEIKVGTSTASNLFRGWAKFDVSEIPNGANITSIKLKFWVNEATTDNHILIITGVDMDPVTTEHWTLRNDIKTGPWFADDTQTYNIALTTGYKEFYLDNNANYYLEGSLQTGLDWFALGFYELGEDAYRFHVDGWDWNGGTDPEPILIIEWEAASQPEITLTPSSHNFGDITVGGYSSEYSFILKNIGTGTATGTVSLTGSNANQYNIAQGSGSFSLTANQTKTIKVKFHPTSFGYKTATLYANGSSQTNNASSSLSGTGIQPNDPEITLTPSSHDFGNITIGEYSSQFSFTLENIGTGTATGTVSITGSNSNQYQITQGGGGFSLTASQTKIIKVKFHPTSLGDKPANLYANGNSNNAGSYLYGTGVLPIDPEITLTPSSHNFGEITVGEYSSLFYFTLENIGNGTATGTVSITGSNSNQFDITLGNGNFALSAGESKTIKVGFHPTSAGYKTATLFANGDPLCNDASSTLTGTGVDDPQITLTPSSYNFGEMTVGDCTSTHTFILENTGGGTATGTVSKTGSNANQFDITQGGGSFSLTANQTKTIKVRFCPTSTGNKTATLFANGISPCNDASSSLSGTGVEDPISEITLTPLSHDFGEMIVGDCTSPYSFIMENSGTSTCTGTVSITGSNANQFEITQGGGSFSLTANQTKTIKVRFCPTSTGNITVNLVVISPCNDVSSSLSGEGINENDPYITVLDPTNSIAWQAGTTQEITWDYGNITGDVKIELFDGNTFYSTIKDQTDCDGSYSWPIPAEQEPGNNYKVKISSIGDPSIFDFSDYFEIIEPIADPYITITNPNGGEVWSVGSTYSITWGHGNFNGYVKIQLYDGYLPVQTIVSSINGAEHQWPIKNNIQAGTNYKIKITSVSNSSIFDLSDSPFSILPNGVNDSHLAKNIKVYPNPAKQNIYIETIDYLQLEEVCIVNNLGKDLYKVSDINGNKQSINVSGFVPGLYFVKVLTKDGYAVKKIIIE